MFTDKVVNKQEMKPGDLRRDRARGRDAMELGAEPPAPRRCHHQGKCRRSGLLGQSEAAVREQVGNPRLESAALPRTPLASPEGRVRASDIAVCVPAELASAANLTTEAADQPIGSAPRRQATTEFVLDNLVWFILVIVLTAFSAVIPNIPPDRHLPQHHRASVFRYHRDRAGADDDRRPHGSFDGIRDGARRDERSRILFGTAGIGVRLALDPEWLMASGIDGDSGRGRWPCRASPTRFPSCRLEDQRLHHDASGLHLGAWRGGRDVGGRSARTCPDAMRIIGYRAAARGAAARLDR